jgi:hypothetical protein
VRQIKMAKPSRGERGTSGRHGHFMDEWSVDLNQMVVYPNARVDLNTTGLLLKPSATSVRRHSVFYV